MATSSSNGEFARMHNGRSPMRSSARSCCAATSKYCWPKTEAGSAPLITAAASSATACEIAGAAVYTPERTSRYSVRLVALKQSRAMQLSPPSACTLDDVGVPSSHCMHQAPRCRHEACTTIVSSKPETGSRGKRRAT
eukprot:2163128-Pleurochrysis_carterae.AAC.3